jgi:hypothetical protein
VDLINWKSKLFINFEEFKNLLLILISSIIFTLTQQIFCKYYYSEIFQFPFVDFSFYAMVSNNMLIHQKESLLAYINSYGIDYYKIFPYHYFELWLCAFIKFVFNDKIFFLYIFVLIPVLATLLFSIYFSFFNYLNINAKYAFVYCILLLNLTLSYPPWKFPLHPDNIFYFQKGFAGFVFLPLIILFYRYDYKLFSCFFLLLFPVFNIAYLPLVGIFIVLLTILFRNNNDSFYFLFYLVIIIILIYLFYFFGETDFVGNIKQNLDWSIYFVRIIDRIFICFKNIFIYCFFYFLPIAIYYKQFKTYFQNYKDIYYFCIAFIFSGILSSALLNFHEESWQLSSISLIPGISIIIILNIKFLFSINRINSLVSLAIVLVLLGNVYTTQLKKLYVSRAINKNFIHKLQFKVNSLVPNINGVFLSDYQFRDYFSFPFCFFPGNVTSLVLNDYCLTLINVPKDLTTFNNSDIKYKNSPIGIFIQNLIIRDSLTSMEDAQFLFLKKNSINYILTEGDYNIPSKIAPYIIDSISDTSSKINIFFIELKKNK